MAIPRWAAAPSADLPQTHSLFDGSPDHDIVVFCRDISEDAVSDSPDLVWTYLDLFTDAAGRSRKPRHLLHTRPGSWTDSW